MFVRQLIKTSVILLEQFRKSIYNEAGPWNDERVQKACCAVVDFDMILRDPYTYDPGTCGVINLSN
jgi:hypothetical protein